MGVAGVVLAAGWGTRMGYHWPPKPLQRLSGGPLASYPLRALASIGVRDFYIVANPWTAGALEEALAPYGQYASTLEVVVLWEYWGENGVSMVAGLSRALVNHEEALLAMSDHVFEPSLAAAVLERLGGDCPIAVAGDPSPLWVDVGEATRIEASRGYVRRLGKGLTSFDYIDTGVFGFTRDALEPLRGALRESRTRSVSEVLTIASTRTPICVAETRGSRWADIDTVEELVSVGLGLAPRVEEVLLTAGVM